RLAPVQAELGEIVMHIVCGRAFYARMISSRQTLNFILSEALSFPLLNVRQLRFRVELFFSEPFGAFQRSDGIVRPDALQIGHAVWCSWRTPSAGTLSSGCCALARSRRGPQQQDSSNGCRKNHAAERSIAHPSLPSGLPDSRAR